MSNKSIPYLTGQTGLEVLSAILRNRSVLSGLSAMHNNLGSPFQITLPGFRPIILAGPESNRHVLVTGRHDFLWRTESDPVTQLLRRGVLVEDGESHDQIRTAMDPSLHRGFVSSQIDAMWRYTNRILDSWESGKTYDMLIEMRKVALLVLMGVLFGEDIQADIDRIWKPILKSIDYISPGAWIIWPDMPRPGYANQLEALDRYLYELIDSRRAENDKKKEDLLSILVHHTDMDDDLIRDQLLTMLIAGHDTSTALLSWALYLFGVHPESFQQAMDEVDEVLSSTARAPAAEELRQLKYLDAVIKETLRLYPPIHIGNRQTARDIELHGYHIPKGARVMYSIYLSHRDPEYWSDPDQFKPDRFLAENQEKRPPFAYVPFGGGPRNCIGAAFSQIEAKTILAGILQRFRLQLMNPNVHAHMGATLEPRPGVQMKVLRRGSGLKKDIGAK